MIVRYLYLSGFILILFPFLGIFSIWKDWIAFGIGVLLLFRGVCGMDFFSKKAKDGQH